MHLLSLKMPNALRLPKYKSKRKYAKYLQVFEFRYDEHLDLGHGWSGDL